MHSKRDNTEAITYENANEVIEELFESLLSRYQIGLEATMRGCGVIFNYLNLMY